MELSAQQFADMVHHLKGPSRFGGPQDQRRAPRVERHARLTITPIADNQPPTPVPVEIKNLSSRGLGFVHAQKLKPRSQFLITLPRQGGDPVQILCTVVHCTPAGTKLFSIGAEFTRLAPTPGQADPATTARIRSSISDERVKT